MAITYEIAKLLVDRFNAGHKLGNVLTFGRQKLAVAQKDLKNLLKSPLKNPSRIETAEEFFYRLGANRIESFDRNSDENATFICDLNAPSEYNDIITSDDTIIDCGTLEHLFNAPNVAITVARQIRIGATYIAAIPANGYYGHGFYQFSSEFWFRLFTPNVFNLEVYNLSFGLFGKKYYKLVDPKDFGVRATHLSPRPTLHIIIATKHSSYPYPIDDYPIQSDYMHQYNLHAGEFDKPLHILHEMFPRTFEYLYNTFYMSRMNPMFWRNNWK